MDKFIIKQGVMTNKNYENESYDIDIKKVPDAEMLVEMFQKFYWESDNIYLVLSKKEVDELSKETQEWVKENA